MIDDCFPKLEVGIYCTFWTIRMQEQSLVVILPQILDAWNDNYHIIKSEQIELNSWHHGSCN